MKTRHLLPLFALLALAPSACSQPAADDLEASEGAVVTGEKSEKGEKAVFDHDVLAKVVDGFSHSTSLPVDKWDLWLGHRAKEKTDTILVQGIAGDGNQYILMVAKTGADKATVVAATTDPASGEWRPVDKAAFAALDSVSAAIREHLERAAKESDSSATVRPLAKTNTGDATKCALWVAAGLVAVVGVAVGAGVLTPMAWASVTGLAFVNNFVGLGVLGATVGGTALAGTLAYKAVQRVKEDCGMGELPSKADISDATK